MLPPSLSPGFVARARAIALQALSGMAPAEAEVTKGHLYPLIETLVKGEPLPLTWNEVSGRFGTNWALTVLVAALSVAALQARERGEERTLTEAGARDCARQLGIWLSPVEAAEMTLAIHRALPPDQPPSPLC